MLDIITFPQVTSIYDEAFYGASHLTEANLPKLTYISTKVFSDCYELVKIFISQTDSVCSLGNKDAFTNCYHILGTTDQFYNPDGLKDGYIYVPAPWWKTDYFEIRYEDMKKNKRYFYQLDGEGIRYQLLSFIMAIKGKKNSMHISEETSIKICDLIDKFNSRNNMYYL